MKLQRIDKGLLGSRLNNELVMLNEENGDYLTLNAVSTTIWDLLEHPVSFEEIVESLLSKFKVDENICRQETQAFLDQLKEYKILDTIE